jgi:hypothetical protein
MTGDVDDHGDSGDFFLPRKYPCIVGSKRDLKNGIQGRESVRLGDDIDDHCSRCKRSTDHSVVSMATTGDEVLVTRCRTCNHEHKYRHNQGRKREMTAKEAYDKLVASMPGAQPAPEPEAPKKRKKKS